MTQGQTTTVVNNHLQAFGRGDVEAIMADYADDAVFFTPDGALHGHAEIRPLFEDLVVQIPPGSTIEIQQQIIEDDVAYLVWNGESKTLKIPFATDTLLVRNGKIHRQTFAAQINPK